MPDQQHFDAFVDETIMAPDHDPSRGSADTHGAAFDAELERRRAIYGHGAVDISVNVPDLNDEDTIFRTAAGYFVKVKTWHDHDASRLGQEVFRVSGSITGPEGKAVVGPDGRPQVHDQGRHLVVASHAPVDLAEQIFRLRHECVLDTVTAFGHRQAVAQIRGIGVRGHRPPPIDYHGPALADDVPLPIDAPATATEFDGDGH